MFERFAQKNEKCNPKAVAASTVNRELSTIKKLLNVAVQNRKLKENPMRFVQMLNEAKPRERHLSEEEKEKLLRSMNETIDCLRLFCSL